MIALQASFRTGSILAAWTDLLQTGDAYSAAEKHRARAVVRIVLASVPHLVLASFLSIEFLELYLWPWYWRCDPYRRGSGPE